MLKLKSLFSVFLAFILLASFNPFTLGSEDELTERFYPENMTESEIENTIKRIANGENVVFGNGVDYHGAENSDEGDSDEWEGDGKNKTHQWLTAVAMEMITNEFTLTSPFLSKNFFKLSASEKATLIQYSDWPDIYERENINSWHFYNARHGSLYGTNYWQNGYDNHTAKSRFVHWYNSAVSKYINHSRVDAYRDLGKALHYFQDLNSPPHTGDTFSTSLADKISAADTGLYKHRAYEKIADEMKATFRVTSGGLYTHHASNTLSSVADTAASHSFGQYSLAYSVVNSQGVVIYADSMRDSIRLPLQRSQRDTAGLIYRFFRDISDYDHSDYWCDEGIVYDDSKDVIA
ncbi:MAG: hypothetical protein FWH04_09555, partial [Oscillospiraceae bacterium]|nr:hypothetical protein [Oscillospiraceae bacterium]